MRLAEVMLIGIKLFGSAPQSFVGYLCHNCSEADLSDLVAAAQRYIDEAYPGSRAVPAAMPTRH